MSLVNAEVIIAVEKTQQVVIKINYMTEKQFHTFIRKLRAGEAEISATITKTYRVEI